MGIEMKVGPCIALFILLASACPQAVVRDAGGALLSFTEVGGAAFDVGTNGNFLSVGDWNSDGYEDLLVDGSRLYVNSGPPSFLFTLTNSAFSSTTSGAANGVWGDYDGDGDLDLYQGCHLETADRLWRNSGPPTYTLVDVSAASFGSWTNTGPSTGSAWCDADGDGDLDIYVGSGENWNNGDPIYYADYLLINDGGAFHDGTVAAGMTTGENFYTRGATWGDFNNDRLPDLYVSHYRIRENHLFVNQDDGSYTEEGRVRNCAGRYDTHVYYDATAGAIYGQYWWGPTYGHTIGSAWADFNNDGRLDLFTSDFVHKYVGYIGSSYDIRGYVCDDGKLYINDGGPWYHFTDYRQGSGIPIWPIGGQGVYQGDQTFSGVTVADIDNDGWQDIYIPQVYGDLPYTTPHMYRNLGAGASAGRMPGTQFQDVTNANGIKGADTYANLFWDYDNDGDVDLVTAGGDTWDGSRWTNYRLRLYRNEGNANHWLKVDLEQSYRNTDCIGARVTLSYTEGGKDVKQMNEVRAGTGHAHQQSSVLLFGLGPSVTKVDMEIVWPDGAIQTIEGVSVDRKVTVGYAIDHPPEILDIWTASATPHEGERVNLSVSCKSYPPSVIRNFMWDINGDDTFDMETVEPWVHFPVHNGGPARAKCRATDNYNVSDEMWIDYAVLNDPPIIDLSDMEVDMDSVLTLPQGTISDSTSDMVNATWSIDWGDGSSVNGTGPGWAEAAHVYTEPGTYHVKVTCTDEDGPVEDWSEVDVSNVLPWGWIEPVKGNGTVFHEDEEIAFKVHPFDTVSDPGPFDISWEWGDGSSDPYSETTRGVHAYSSRGTYEVQARVKDSFGGVGIIAGSASVENDPPAISVKGPSSVKTEEDRKLDLGQYVECTDTKSDVPGLRYWWDFGDGDRTEPATSPDALHAYRRSGDYVAVCTATDGDGGSSNASIAVRVEDVAPTVLSLTAPVDVKEDETFTISVEASDTPSDMPSLVCTLGLGDGRTVQGFTSEAAYGSSGTYSITATVTDDDGEWAVSYAEVFVRNVAPSGGIEAPSGQLYEDAPVTFRAVDLSDTPSDMASLNVTWDLGQGPKIYGEEASRTFTASGTYKVKMTVSDGDISESYTRTVTVLNLAPAAVATADRTEVEAGEAVHFTANLSTDTPTDRSLLRYEWEIEGQKVPGPDIEWTFDAPGTFTATLTVADPEGASATDSVRIVVAPVESDGSDGNSLLLIAAVVAALIMIAIVIGIAVLLFIRRAKDRPTVPAPMPLPVQPMMQAPMPPPAPPIAQAPVPPPPQPPATI